MVGAESFQIIWVVGVQSFQITWVVGVLQNLITWVVGVYSFAKLKNNGLHLSLNYKTVLRIACKIQFCFESKPFDFSSFQYFSLLFFLSFKISSEISFCFLKKLF